MSAPNYTNNTNSNELANQSKGGVEHVIPGDTGPSTFASPGTPGIEHAQVDQAPRLDGITSLGGNRRGTSLGQRPSTATMAMVAVWGVSFNRETTSAR
jgi:hypothetical protein